MPGLTSFIPCRPQPSQTEAEETQDRCHGANQGDVPVHGAAVQSDDPHSENDTTQGGTPLGDHPGVVGNTDDEPEIERKVVESNGPDAVGKHGHEDKDGEPVDGEGGESTTHTRAGSSEDFPD